MKYLFIFIFLSIFAVNSFSQSKQIKLAYQNFTTENHDLVLKSLNRFKFEYYDLFLGIENQNVAQRSSDLQNLSSYYFLKTNLFFKKTPYSNIDSAYLSMMLLKKEVNKFEKYNKGLYDASCLTYKLCLDKCSVLESEIEDSLLFKYTKDKEIYTYEAFLQKYPKSKNYQMVLNLREDLIISNALETKDLVIIEESLKEVLNPEKIKEVRSMIENTLINEAIATNSEKKLLFCLEKFPTTLRRRELEGTLENIFIADAKKTRNISKLKSFSEKFPFSSRSLEVSKMVENFIIDDAISSRNISKINESLLTYPNSLKQSELLFLLEFLEIEDAVTTKDQDKIIYCINKYPLNPSIIYMKDMLLVK